MVTASDLAATRYFHFTRAGRELFWNEWDGVYVVFQPSSAETHVFNETTIQVLRCLNERSLSIGEIKEQAETALGIGDTELPTADFEFATMRLEELGLIERQDPDRRQQ